MEEMGGNITPIRSNISRFSRGTIGLSFWHVRGYLRIRLKIQALRICNALRESLVGKPSKTSFVWHIRPMQSNISGMLGRNLILFRRRHTVFLGQLKRIRNPVHYMGMNQ